MYSLVRRWPQSLKKLKIRKLILGLLISDILKWTSSPIPIPPLQDICRVRENLSLCCFGVSRTVLPFFPPSVHFLTLPSPTLLYASLWMWHRGPRPLPSPALRCLWSSENHVQLGCLSRCWKMEGWHRYRSRWHCTLGIIFSDKLGLGLQILAFACYSHSYQNITMKIRYFCRKGIETYFFQRFKITCVEVS